MLCSFKIKSMLNDNLIERFCFNLVGNNIKYFKLHKNES
jgi:hypothetical protein